MKKYFLFLKLILLLIILWWIFKSVNLSETIQTLTKTNLAYFVIAFIINNLSSIFLTIKWHRLAMPLGIKSGLLELFRLNYISMFYSIFVPGQASGEIIKGYKLFKKEGTHQNVWIPIFIDKITNFLITLIIGFIAILFDENFRQNTSVIFITSILTVFLSLLTIVLFTEKTGDFFKFLKNNLLKVLKILRIESKLIKDFSIDYFEKYKKHNSLMYETLLWSLLIKLPHIFGFFFLALSLNIPLDLVQCAWLFSIVSITTLLPISFSGLGVREGTVIVLLSQLGIDKSLSLSLSLLIYITAVLVGLIGGLLELFSGIQIKSKNK